MNAPPVPDPVLLARAFDRAAESFASAAYVQREIASRLLARFDYFKIEPKVIVDLGCATGEATRKLAERFPAADVLGVEWSARMIEVARAGSPWWKRHLPFLGAERLRFAALAADRLPLADGAADLVWSNLALHWRALDAVLAEAHRCLATDGLLLFSTFGPDTLKELREAFAGVDAFEHVARFIDMHDVGDALVHAGFANPVMDMETITVEFDTLADLARDLAALGARNRLPGRGPGLLGRGGWQRVLAAYERQRRNGKLPATLEIVYGHAWKPEPRTAGDGRAVVQFRPYRRAAS